MNGRRDSKKRARAQFSAKGWITNERRDLQKRAGLNSQRRSEKRKDEEVRNKEQELDSQRRAEKRMDEEFRNKEQELDSQRRVEKRKDPNVRKKEIAGKKKKKPNLFKKVHEWKNMSRYRLSEFNVECTNCSALDFKEEKVGNKSTFSDCCSHGDFLLEPMGTNFPVELKLLFVQSKPSSLHNIRAVNGNLAMVKQYEFKTGGPYCFRISGQVNRNFDTAAMPDKNKVPHEGLLFFLDTDDALDIRQEKLNADPKDIEMIHNCLVKNNKLAERYIMMKEEMERQEAMAKEKG